MKLLRAVPFIFLSILFLLQPTIANAEEVPGTRLTDPLDTPGNTRWKCAFDKDGQRIIRENPFTSGKPDRKPCPVYQDQQSICAEVANEELGKGVICEYTPAGSSNPQPIGQTGDLSWTINKTYIDENVLTVEITFSGLAHSENFYLYPKTDQKGARLGNLSEINSGNGKITLQVCGNGKDALKGKGIGKKSKDCKVDGSDYFHEGNIYRLGLYDDENGEAQLMVAEFLVRHSAPIIKISSTPRGTLPALIVALSRTRPGGGDRNNYQLELAGEGNYKENQCIETNKSQDTIKLNDQTDFLIPVPPITETNPKSVTFARADNKSGLEPGLYKLRVNERVDDAGIGQLKGGCYGGFTYVEITLQLAKDGSITIIRFEFDPEGEEYKAFLEYLAEMRKLGGPIAIPCEDGKNKTLNIKCPSINTAIGSINVTPQGFVEEIFKYVLMIAGFGAIIIIIYAGYVLMTSAGDKEKIAGARETITSAIVGLLFIILSIVILEIIGIDILRIPGFERGSNTPTREVCAQFKQPDACWAAGCSWYNSTFCAPKSQP